MIPKLNPIIHSELRLAIMSVLANANEVDFQFIQKITGANSGNISVQISKLEEAGYISIDRFFVGKKPRLKIRITQLGRKAYNKYLETLHELLSMSSYTDSEKEET